MWKLSEDGQNENKKIKGIKEPEEKQTKTDMRHTTIILPLI